MWDGLTATDIGKDSVVSEKRKPECDDAEQSKLFIEKAREIGADEDKSVADDVIGNLAKMPPEPRNKPQSR
jgi:hypothetical protein